MSATDDLNRILDFLRAAGALKDTLRSAHTDGGRRESTAEHTWRLCLWAMLFGDRFDGVDPLHLIKLCIVHDLAEAISGDIPAIDQVDSAEKSAQERADLWGMTANLPDAARDEIRALWAEYDAAQTLAAQAAKGLDKLETILQHNSGANPADFDYAFNLDYGTTATDRHPFLREVRRILDADTLANHNAQQAS